MQYAMLTIGSRKSILAQTQTDLVRDMLLAAWPDLQVKVVLVDTQGDLNRHDPLPAIGGKGLFTAELEAMLRQETIDLAVHSLKDLPVEDAPGLTVLAIPARANPADALVCRTARRVKDLPEGAVVGTSSLRRAAQLLIRRPDLQIKDIRGNVETRLRKLDDPEWGYTATILAQAGLERLDLEIDYATPLDSQTMLAAPGQGALGIQGRANDERVSRYLSALDHLPTRVAVTAERTFLAGLGGGCSIPVGALGQVKGENLILSGLVAQPNGEQVIRVSGQASISEAAQLGLQLAEEALALGARELLASDL